MLEIIIINDESLRRKIAVSTRLTVHNSHLLTAPTAIKLGKPEQIRAKKSWHKINTKHQFSNTLAQCNFHVEVMLGSATQHGRS